MSTLGIIASYVVAVLGICVIAEWLIAWSFRAEARAADRTQDQDRGGEDA